MSWRGRIVKLARRYEIKSYVEVGVRKGRLSFMMMKNVPTLDEVYLVDPWKKEYLDMRVLARPPHKKDIFGEESQERTDKIYEKVYKTAKTLRIKYKIPTVVVMRMTSVEAAKILRNHSVDMVFIDGLHLYENVVEDIKVWTHKLTPGGILIGDDYGKNYPGVVKAVDEARGFSFLGELPDTKGRIWWKTVSTK